MLRRVGVGVSGPPLELPVDGVVEVWRIPLRPSAAGLERLVATLAPDERARAARLRGDHLATRFVAGRGAMRVILGGYLGRPAQALRFSVGEHGKPAVDDPGPLRFNLSNSGDLALLAVARGCEVGVDLEAVRPVPDALAIARRMFSPAEQAALAACGEAGREAAFLRCWTRKEAFIKAQGGGVWAGLDTFDVSLDEDRAAVLAVHGSAERASRWAMRALDPGPGYLGAVVVEGGLDSVQHRDWEELPLDRIGRDKI